MEIRLISYTDSDLSLLKEMVPFFSPIGLCLPWEKAMPVIVDEQTITALYPPDDLKPDISFERTLNDCLQWLEEQGEKSRVELLKAGPGTGVSEESLYQIRHLLTSRESDASITRNMTNRWHLLMHLADKIEENRKEANRMLDALKKRPSPLADSLDQTGKSGYPLETLTEINNDSLLNNTHITHYLSAWFGLFKSLIKDDRILLTLNSQIFNNLSEKWDMFCGKKELQEEKGIYFKFPLVSSLDPKEQERLKTDEAVKEKCAQFKEMISTKDSDPVQKKTYLEKIIREFEAMFSDDMLKNHMLFTLLFFDPPVDKELPEKGDLLKLLSGKALILAEKIVM